MPEEPSLPRLTWKPDRSPRSSSPHKRARLSSPVVSSDPVFSSEDDPSVDDYNQERRKRRYRGPWYRPQVASDLPDQELDPEPPTAERKVKRTLQRQFDSGVWLGSDLTDSDEAVDSLGPVNGFLNSRFHSRQAGLLRANHNQSPTPEEFAQKQIEICLETGNEIIDLSSLSLTTISNTTIRPLASFACIPRVSSINEGTFSPLVPHLKIFLSSNLLTALPAELFNLDQLSVLSLRGNLLQELPSAIGNLHNLTELNVSQNSLHYLPYEILDLFANKSQLRSFQIHPNPFIAPQESHGKDDKSDCVAQGARRHLTRARQSWPLHPQWHLEFKGRSETRYLSIEGDLCKGPVFLRDGSESQFTGSSSEELTVLISQSTMNSVPFVSNLDLPPQQYGHLSRAPSLIETSLIACSKSQQLPYLPNLLPDDSPEKLRTLLLRASLLKASGGNKCTICSRNFIIPRTEWIEWWGITKLAADSKPAAAPRQMENSRDAIESTVPLIRRGCSWLCGPEDLVVHERE